MKRKVIALILVIVLLTLPQESLAQAPVVAPPIPIDYTKPLNFDDRLSQVANDYPEFGGFYVDESAGTVVIFVKNEASRSPMSARAALSPAVGSSYDLTTLQPVFRPADYSFRQLKPWHDALTRVAFTLPGVTLTDIDDQTNRLRVGVDDLDEQSPAVLDAAKGLGVPQGAVIIEQVPGPVAESSLTSYHRPLVGGLQVATGGFVCSLGVVGVRSGTNGFVTNSHCTNVQGGVEGTNFGQPTASNFVGTESVDPFYFTGGACPAQRQCRYSDAAFVTTSNATINRGYIANPSGSYWNGSLSYRIVSEWNEPPTGTTVFKVGRTTGKTSGTMAGTCVNYLQSGSNFVFLCEAQASYSSDQGDSGAPVFRVISGADVELVGIHWGSGGVFSDWYSGVQGPNEIYLVSTCASGYSC